MAKNKVCAFVVKRKDILQQQKNELNLGGLVSYQCQQSFNSMCGEAYAYASMNRTLKGSRFKHAYIYIVFFLLLPNQS